VQRALKWLGIGLGALVGLLVVFVGFLYFVNWNWFRGIANEQGSKAAGRQFAIDGDLKVNWDSWTLPHVHAERIRLANADWSKEPNMVEIAVLDFQLDLRQLLKGRIALPELTLTRPKIVLEKPDAKRKNWDMSVASPGGAVVKTTVPQKRTQVPVIGQLVITDGTIAYTDVPAKLSIHSQITTAVGTGADKEQRILLNSRGTVENEPFTLNVEGGSILSLRDPHKPYPLSVKLQAGPTRFDAEGTMTDPVQMVGIDLRLDVKGDSMSKIFPFTGIPLPPTPPFEVSGRLRKDKEVWYFEQAQGRMGGSDLTGDLSYDGRKTKAEIKADITSKLLDFKDLAGFVGGETNQDAKAEKAAASDRVLPNIPLNLSRLRAANMDARFRAQRINAPDLPIDNMDTHFILRDGRLTIDPLKFGVADGTISGVLVLDGRQDVPQVDADLQLQRLSLKRFLEKTSFESLSEGRFGGHVKLAGTGKSLADVLATSGGRLSLTMSGGQVSVLMMHAADIDVAKAVTTLLGTDKPTPLRCAIADFHVDRGVANSEMFLIDTAQSHISGTAIVDFRDEGLDIRFEGKPKKPSPFVATTPITIKGKMKSPSIGIEAAPAIARVAAATGLGIIFPALAVIPFIEMGLGKDAPCGELIEQVQASQ
jgi:uncharacterized protein involved in outer membrane biogenesis